ncbi:hypothetical protein ACQP2E_04880 [Actinoplanes sp. CA-015351]|uniref:hypothetical protein n=1 Tax=Actinoplanes sp. CA-015351 TaxID=3239897 RepID=UPI003D99543F
MRNPGQVTVDVGGRSESEEGRPVGGCRGEPQLGGADPGERRVVAQQPVDVADDCGVPGYAEFLQLTGERAARVAMLHRCPQSAPRQ